MSLVIANMHTGSIGVLKKPPHLFEGWSEHLNERKECCLCPLQCLSLPLLGTGLSLLRASDHLEKGHWCSIPPCPPPEPDTWSHLQRQDKKRDSGRCADGHSRDLRTDDGRLAQKIADPLLHGGQEHGDCGAVPGTLHYCPSLGYFPSNFGF
ncbi:hypothetical protein DNTS_026985 [Danionella cerebrum]|uniref:Uncharacterized protein n=1 Tax=Danionella cerebrum TaxID=2873325 RepID=A0A553N584_9TELE|nr:hypothetical protein DNTS_026985 [Danionella translucida]